MLYYLVESILIFICSFNAILSDVIGIIVGHIYYYLVDVLPKIAEIRRWKRKDFLPTPKFMYIKIFLVNNYLVNLLKMKKNIYI